MTKGNPKNVAASVRQRLQNLARERKEDFQLVLSRYAIERLLHRIGQSVHRDRFVVKGAMLFHLWTDQTYRPTRDIDFLAHGDHSVIRRCWDFPHQSFRPTRGKRSLPRNSRRWWCWVWQIAGGPPRQHRRTGAVQPRHGRPGIAHDRIEAGNQRAVPPPGRTAAP